MSFKDDFAAGCAIASFEALSTLLHLLLLQGSIPKPVTLELLEQTLQRLEAPQAADPAQSEGKSALEGPMKAARLQLTMLLEGLRQLPVPGSPD